MPLALPPEQGYLEMVVQPMSSLRFRYPSEAGKSNILGEGEEPCPAIRVRGFTGEAKVYAFLVTVPEDNETEMPKPHPHRLDGPNCADGIFSKTITITEADNTIKFEKLNLVNTKSKDWKNELLLRERKKIDPFRTGYDHKDRQKEIDRNYVAMCFQMVVRINKKVEVLKPICSSPIAHSTGKRVGFEIVRISPDYGPRSGKKHMILLMNGISRKGDIQSVRFYDDATKWSAYGNFEDRHVHEMAAIRLVYPEYDSAKFPPKGSTVKVELITSRGTTPSVSFRYHPEETTKPKRVAKFKSNPDSAASEVPTIVGDQQTNSNLCYSEVSFSSSLSMPSNPQPVVPHEPRQALLRQPVQPEPYLMEDLGGVPNTVGDLKSSLESNTTTNSIQSGSSLGSGSLDSGFTQTQSPLQDVIESTLPVSSQGERQQGHVLLTEPLYALQENFNQNATPDTDNMMDTSTQNIHHVTFGADQVPYIENSSGSSVTPVSNISSISFGTDQVPYIENPSVSPIAPVSNISLISYGADQVPYVENASVSPMTPVSNISSTDSRTQYRRISSSEFRQQNAAQGDVAVSTSRPLASSTSSVRYVNIQPKVMSSAVVPPAILSRPNPVEQQRPVPKKRLTPPRPKDRPTGLLTVSQDVTLPSGTVNNQISVYPGASNHQVGVEQQEDSLSLGRIYAEHPEASGPSRNDQSLAVPTVPTAVLFNQEFTVPTANSSQLVGSIHNQRCAVPTANNSQQLFKSSPVNQGFTVPRAINSQQSLGGSLVNQEFTVHTANNSQQSLGGSLVNQGFAVPTTNNSQQYFGDALVNQGFTVCTTNNSQLPSGDSHNYQGYAVSANSSAIQPDLSDRELLQLLQEAQNKLASESDDDHDFNEQEALRSMFSNMPTYQGEVSLMPSPGQADLQTNSADTFLSHNQYHSSPQNTSIQLPSSESQTKWSRFNNPSTTSQSSSLRHSAATFDSNLGSNTGLQPRLPQPNFGNGIRLSQPPVSQSTFNSMTAYRPNQFEVSQYDIKHTGQTHGIVPPLPSSLPTPMFGTQPFSSQSNYVGQQSQQPPAPHPHVQLHSQRQTSMPLADPYRDPRSIRSSVSADDSSPLPRSHKSQSTNSSSPHSNQPSSQESQDSNGVMAMMTESFVGASSISMPSNPDSLDDLMDIITNDG